jgi:hypothetical protein
MKNICSLAYFHASLNFCRKKQVEKWKKEITWSQDKNFPFSSVADPDPLVRGTYSVPDPCIIKQKSKKTLDSYCFVIYLSLFMLDI